ncbi:MAG: hypothetical protein M5R40_00985 [Anaerolineae bacterium]|nr:hypothetical protein [Anaerolineae bacterium]
MTGYIIKRLTSLLFVMVIVSIIVFTMMNLLPGGPYGMGERGHTQEALENLKRKYGLDKPPLERYLIFFTNALRLDFGNSFSVAGNPPSPKSSRAPGRSRSMWAYTPSSWLSASA